MLLLVLFLPLVIVVEGHYRIIGGREAKIEEFPYQVSLENGGYHRAGGILVRPDVVVTAAQTVHEYSAYMIIVRAGSTKCSNFYSMSDEGETAGVAKLYIHPRYNPVSFNYDVAVLHLNRSFSMGAKSQPLLLLDRGGYVLDGTFANVSGWGANAYNSQLSKILRTIELPKFNFETCRMLYRELSDHQVCYGYEGAGRSFTEGDEGGPLVINKKLVGVASTGYSDSPKKPNIFINVAHYEIFDFITSLFYNPYS